MSVITRTVLREQVKQVLLERLLAGEYEPGERLVETRIAQELGTSQTPVREALRDLELLRFVESAPFRGSWVREVSPDELAEIYPVRGALEELAAREAASRLGGRVEALELELAAMRDAAERGDLQEQVEHDVAFHRLIVEAARNSILLEVWSSLRVETRTLVTALAAPLDQRELAETHVPILEALRTADPVAAGLAAREHLQRFRDLLIPGGSRDATR